MKLTPNQMNKLGAEVYKALSSVSNIKLASEKEDVMKLVVRILKQNMEDEKNLDQKVQTMMEQLEKQNPNSFERYKMFPLLKKRLAEQEGFVL